MSGRLESINSSRGGVPKASMFEALVTEQGLDGDVQIGDVRLHITKYTTPCQIISASFLGSNFTRISQRLHSGCSRVCAHVLAGGLIRVGDPVTTA